MTDLGNVAGEILDHGFTTQVDANFGSFTEQDHVFAGGTLEEDNDSGRRVGTYSAPILPADPVKLDESVDLTRPYVQVVATGDNGDVLYGIWQSWRSKAGDLNHDGVIYRPNNGDVLVFEAGTEVDSTNITAGDSVSFSADGRNRDAYPHGLRVQQDNTNGIGRARNEVASAGERVAVEINPAL